VPLGKDNLTAAEVGRLLGLSVHTLSYWSSSIVGLLRAAGPVYRASLSPGSLTR
jgi:hypothetical protein